MSESKKGGGELPKLKKIKRGDVDFGLFAHRFMSHNGTNFNEVVGLFKGYSDDLEAIGFRDYDDDEGLSYLLHSTLVSTARLSQSSFRPYQ